MPNFEQIDGPATLVFAAFVLRIMFLMYKSFEKYGEKTVAALDRSTDKTTEAIDRLSDRVAELVKTTDDHEKEQLKLQLDIARQRGEDMGLIKAGLGELLEHSREQRRASGSDTDHPPARREDMPRAAHQ